jgi:membrane protein DedA with SNARE-associated domain
VPSELTVATAYAVLFVAACLRGAMTYALGRTARHAGDASRLRGLFQRPVMRRTERVVQRYGAPAVSLSFLTVGVQSAVNASAGVLRMPLRFYLPGLTVGALLWAGVYLSGRDGDAERVERRRALVDPARAGGGRPGRGGLHGGAAARA